MGLRRRIGESFELAALPGTTEEDRKKALHFCVVGGGPTGGRACSMCSPRCLQAMGQEWCASACAILTILHLEPISARVCAMIFYDVMLCAGAELAWAPSVGIVEKCRVPLSPLQVWSLLVR